jgi:uncharacterized protein HemX
MKDSKQLNDKIEDVAIDPVDRLLKEKKPASSGKGIAILALLVALATVSESAWQWWQARSAGTDVAAQQETMSRIQQNQQQFARSMGTVEARLKSMDEPGNDGEISSLGQQFASLESKITGMQSQSGMDKASMAALQGGLRSNDLRLSTVEAGLSSVAANSQNSGAELDLAEIDFLLRVANERLQLFADPSAADLALQAADVQIDALQDPMFLSVRQRIATSREALAAVPRIDRVELSARISSMQAGIRSLPFRGETSSAPTAELPAETGWWASLKQTLSSLVTVRRRVPEEETLLSLEDKDYLRQGLWLQLESARLALMRKDADTYLGSLLRVKQTIEQYFANGSSPVQALLLEITTLERVEVAPVMPDVSAAWTQLRQLRDSRRLLQSVPPAVTEPVEAGDSGE